MKVISWPTPTGLGVTDMKTAVGTKSLHRVHMSNLLVEALVLSAPVKSHFMPAALAAAVALSNAAVAGCIAKSGIDIPTIRITVIKVAIVLFLFVCIFLFLIFSLGIRASLKLEMPSAHKLPLLAMIVYKMDWKVVTADKFVSIMQNFMNSSSG
jgi:hypothetical protein